VALRFVGKTTKKESTIFRVREEARRRKRTEKFSRPRIFFFSAN
jgi:hypothetical protein